MRNCLYICFLLFASLFINAQDKQKTYTGVFEYVSAQYEENSGNIIVQCKNNSGEIYLFQLLNGEAVTNGSTLYNLPAPNKPVSKKITTRTELVGKKIQLFYQPIVEIDPANPYCCYKITGVNPL